MRAGLSTGKYFGAMIDFVYVLQHGYFVPNTRLHQLTDNKKNYRKNKTFKELMS